MRESIIVNKIADTMTAVSFLLFRYIREHSAVATLLSHHTREQLSLLLDVRLTGGQCKQAQLADLDGSRSSY